jgi:hypothetical protein
MALLSDSVRETLDTISSNRKSSAPKLLPEDFSDTISQTREKQKVLDDLHEKRRAHWREKYVWPMMDANPSARKVLAIKAAAEIRDRRDQLWLASEIAQASKAQGWQKKQDYQKLGAARKASEAPAEVMRSIFRGGQKWLMKYQDLGRAIAGRDNDANKLAFRELLEGAYQYGSPDVDPEANKAWQFTMQAAEQALPIYAGAKTYKTFGAKGLAAQVGLGEYAGERSEKMIEGASPTAASLMAVPTAAIQGIIETANPIPFKASAAVTGAINRVLNKAVKNKMARGVIAGVGGGAASAVRESAEEFAQKAASGTSGQILAAGRGEGVDVGKVLKESAGAFTRSLGPMSIYGAIGAGGHLTGVAKDVQQQKYQEEILRIAAEGRPPTRKEWKRWGMDPQYGKSELDRKENIQEVAAYISQIKKAEEGAQGAAVAPTEPGAEPPPLPQTPQPEPGQQAQGPIQEAAQQQPSLEAQSIDAIQMPEVDAQEPVVATTEQPAGLSEADATERISTKAAIRDFAIRKNRGESAVPDLAPETVEQWLDEAQSQIDAGWAGAEKVDVANNLVQELNEKPRNLSPVEWGVLQIHYRGMANRLDKISDEIARAPDAMTRIEANARSAILVVQMQQVETAAKAAGVMWGRAGRAQQIELLQDYSPAALIRRAVVANGKALNVEESSKVVELSKRVQELEARLEARGIGQGDLESEVESSISEIAKDVQRATRRRRTRAYKRQAAEQEIEAAWSQFRDTAKSIPGLSDLFSGESGALNVDVAQSAAKLIKAYANLGALTFTEFTARVQQKFGQQSPGSLQVFEGVWEQLAKSNLAPIRDLDINDEASISREVQRMQHSLIEAGVTNRTQLVKMITDEMRKVVPQMTAQNVMHRIALKDVPPADADQKPMVAYKRNLQQRIEDYQQRRQQITEGTYQKPVKTQKEYDKQTMDLKWRLAQEKSQFREMEDEWRKRQMHLLKRSALLVPGVLNISRSILTSMDLSALGRQGGLIIMGHPIMGIKSLKPMIKALRSERGEFEILEKIREHELASWYGPAGLGITLLEGRLSKQEEVWMGGLLHKLAKVPGLGKLLQPILASERAYVSTMNILRADLFDQMANTLISSNHEMTLDEAKAIAHYVNVVSGRGSLGSAERVAAGLATIFFAPKYVVSRFQWLAMQPLWKGNLNTRKLIAKEYARTILGMATMYASLMLTFYVTAGDSSEEPKISMDPDSPDFGKIRVGDHVVDLPAAGLAQVFRLTFRTGKSLAYGAYELVAGRKKTMASKRRRKYMKKSLGVIGGGVRSKLSPYLSNVSNIMVGKDIVGNEITPWVVLEDTVVPLSVRDIVMAMKNDNVPNDVIFSAAAIFGANIQSYKKKKRNR